MRARYYDPATEQFISRDPMETASGQPYVYAGANPVNATDPSGNCPICPFLIGAALAVGGSVAVGVGIDYVGHPDNFDLMQSIGSQFSDPWTYVAAIPGGALGKLARLGRFGRLFSWLGRAAPEGKVAVIGELGDTARFFGRKGFDTIQDYMVRNGIRDWSIAVNDQWVREVAESRLGVFLASRMTRATLTNLPGSAERTLYGYWTVFGREARAFLRDYGYVKNGRMLTLP